MTVLLNCPCKHIHTSGFSDRFVVVTSLTVSGLFSLAGVFLEVALKTYYAFIIIIKILINISIIKSIFEMLVKTYHNIVFIIITLHHYNPHYNDQSYLRLG